MLGRLLEALTQKEGSTDTAGLMQYAGTLSEATKGLDRNGLLKCIIKFGQKNPQSKVVDITERLK